MKGSVEMETLDFQMYVNGIRETFKDVSKSLWKKDPRNFMGFSDRLFNVQGNNIDWTFMYDDDELNYYGIKVKEENGRMAYIPWRGSDKHSPIYNPTPQKLVNAILELRNRGGGFR